MSKIGLENFVEFGVLFEVYGNLLSEDRKEIMAAYFTYNNTLAEIAEDRKISRQAVLDAIDKSCEKLRKFEAALKFVQHRGKILNLLQNLEASLQTCEDKQKVEKIIKEI